MSLLDRLRRKPSVLLHIERNRLSLLVRAGSAWQILFITDIAHTPAHTDDRPLQAALREVMQHLTSPSVITVLCDSRWAPLSMLQTGSRPLQQTQLQALVQHRFSEIYGARTVDWHYSIEYRAGDAQALAFALPNGLRTAIRQLTTPSDSKAHEVIIAPTFGWIWNTVWRKNAARNAWLIANEQDRSIVMRLKGGRCIALQPSGPHLTRTEEAMAAVQTEAKRFGIIDQIDNVSGFSFEPLLPDSVASTAGSSPKWTNLLAEVAT